MFASQAKNVGSIPTIRTKLFYKLDRLVKSVILDGCDILEIGKKLLINI